MWTQKYKPKTFNDIIGLNPAIIENSLRKDFKHLMLVSKYPGTGKTTTADVIQKVLDTDTLRLNGSDTRGIDVIRTSVKEFAMSKASKPDKFKLIRIEEMDYLCLPPETEIITGNINNPIIRKLQDLKFNHNIMIPSVNELTGQIENDKGKLVDSGESEFYEIELEDGRIIRAGVNHPFFKKNFEKIKLKDLIVGDEILDYSNEILHECQKGFIEKGWLITHKSKGVKNEAC